MNNSRQTVIMASDAEWIINFLGAKELSQEEQKNLVTNWLEDMLHTLNILDVHDAKTMAAIGKLATYHGWNGDLMNCSDVVRLARADGLIPWGLFYGCKWAVTIPTAITKVDHISKKEDFEVSTQGNDDNRTN